MPYNIINTSRGLDYVGVKDPQWPYVCRTWTFRHARDKRMQSRWLHWRSLVRPLWHASQYVSKREKLGLGGLREDTLAFFYFINNRYLLTSSIPKHLVRPFPTPGCWGWRDTLCVWIGFQSLLLVRTDRWVWGLALGFSMVLVEASGPRVCEWIPPRASLGSFFRLFEWAKGPYDLWELPRPYRLLHPW